MTQDLELRHRNIMGKTGELGLAPVDIEVPLEHPRGNV